MKLEKLFNEYKGSEQGEQNIASLVIDSRKASEGSLFFAVKGLEADGHAYIPMAIEKGAVAIVCSDKQEEREGIAYIYRDDVIGEIGRCSSAFYGNPGAKMTMYGVTGTNGKSTTTCIIKDLHEKASGKACGYMGTIAVRYGDVDEKPSLTTPDAIDINDYLSKMEKAGMKSVSMEVSSHGLALRRTEGLDFDVAIFTNFSWDHLDFHKTMEAYFEAKKSLFTGLKPEATAILNLDDDSFEKLKEACKCKVLSYGVNAEADYCIKDLYMSASGSEFDLILSEKACGKPKGESYHIRTNITAAYNISNLTAAIAGLHCQGFDMEKLIEACVDVKQVDGRMERVQNELGIDLIIDYAHTPDGFDKIFEFARSVKNPDGRLYAVFGSAGKRDKEKRHVLGRIASVNCDYIILTEEDPRDEAACDIANQIALEIPKESYEFIDNRYEAISKAIAMAKAGDMVLVLGKGDERYLERSKGKESWMGDEKAAAEIAAKIARV